MPLLTKDNCQEYKFWHLMVSSFVRVNQPEKISLVIKADETTSTVVATIVGTVCNHM